MRAATIVVLPCPFVGSCPNFLLMLCPSTPPHIRDLRKGRQKVHTSHLKASCHMSSISITAFPDINYVTYEAQRMWGRLIFYVVMVSAILHAGWGLVTAVKMLLRGDGLQTILVPIVYFMVGGAYGFAIAAAPAGGLVLCHSTLEAGMTDLEMIIYSFVLCTLIIFYSSGKTSTIYSF